MEIPKLWKPVAVRIGHNARSAPLYRLEEKRDQAIQGAADQLGELIDLNMVPFNQYDNWKWGLAVPQALFDTLNRYDKKAATLAAIGFLETQGYLCTKNT